MAATFSFNELLFLVARRLAEVGFRRSGNSFYLREGSNWGFVNFQKSSKSTADLILFTVNVGTASGALLNFSGLRTLGVPKPDQWHWRKRLGFFFPNPADTWWRIDATTSPSAVGEEILDALVKLALPALRTYISDARLVELWTSGDSPGLTEVDRLRYLSVLLKLEGSVEALNNTKDRLQQIADGRPFAGAVASYLRRLNNVHDA
jgi:hypothetical protein